MSREAVLDLQTHTAKPRAGKGTRENREILRPAGWTFCYNAAMRRNHLILALLFLAVFTSFFASIVAANLFIKRRNEHIRAQQQQLQAIQAAQAQVRHHQLNRSPDSAD
jgi:hypothetical protein